MMDKSTARENAMKLAFEWDMGGVGGEETEYGTLEIEEGDKEIKFINKVVNYLTENQESVDALISEYLRSWTIDRLNKVDLAILRIAVSEMLMKTTPVPVVVNEAVKMAKSYSNDNSPSFINGVLGAIGRSGKV